MFIAISCDKSDIVNADETANSGQKDLYAVPINIADEVALTFSIKSDTLDTGSKHLRKGNGKGKKSTETVTDEEGNPLFYIINFKEGGFVTVSADYRAMPVIAFNDTGELHYERDKGINGLAVWFDQSKQQLKEIKKSNKDVEKVIEKAWKEYLKDGFVFPTNKNGRPSNQNCQEWYTVGQFMCQNLFYERGPLVQTNWGQQGLSNFYTPDDNQCSHCHDNAVAGCGPVAMAQTLRAIGVLHGNFGGRNYGAMPIFSTPCRMPLAGGEDEMAHLIADCGQNTLTDYHFFSCGTLTLPFSIPSGMSSMGLSIGGSTTTLFNPTIVRQEINLNYPVILKGKDSLLNQHIWVCSGYKVHEYSEYNCDTHSCNTFGYSWYHMNWGWNGGGNGWYAIGAFNPGSSSYNNSIEVIHGFRK